MAWLGIAGVALIQFTYVLAAVAWVQTHPPAPEERADARPPARRPAQATRR